MQKGNDSGGRILKNTEKQGDAKKKKKKLQAMPSSLICWKSQRTAEQVR